MGLYFTPKKFWFKHVGNILASSKTIALSGLARQLVQAGLLDEDTALEAYNRAKEEKIPLVRHLVSNAIVDAKAISTIASHEFGVPVFDLNSFDSENIPLDAVSPDLIKKHHALPLFKRGNRLFIAVSDPTNTNALEEIRFNTGITTDSILVEDNKLSDLIEKVLDKKDSESLDSDFDDGDLENLDIESVDEEADAPVDTVGDDAPIVRFVNKILLDAIKKGASDLHFEPYEKSYRVRFRIDGVLQEVAAPPK